MLKLLIELIFRSILPPFYSFTYIEKVCREKLEKHCNNKDVLWVLGNLYVWYEKYAEALPHFELLLRVAKDSRGVRLILSKIYYNLDCYEEVVKILDNPNTLNKNDIEIYYIAHSMVKLEKYKEASKQPTPEGPALV